MLTPHLSRRSLLAVVPAAALPFAGKSRVVRDADVIVVGAGLSGLHAAQLLEEAGQHVIVLEGATGVGGRVRTLHDAPERCETGGSEIGPYYARVLSQAERFNLTLRAGAIPKIDFALHIDGTVMAPGAWATSPRNTVVGPAHAMPPYELSAAFLPRDSGLKELDSWLEDSRASEDPSLLELCRRRNADPLALRLLAAGIEADDLAMESVLWARRRRKIAEWAGNGLAAFSHIVGGMSLLPEAMAASLHGDVLLGRRVTAITTGRDKATVTCADGQRFRASHVICTVPLPMLRRIALEPGLPKLQAEAVAQIPYGQAVSLYLRVTAPFWEEDKLGSSLWSDTLGRAMRWATPSGEYIWVMVGGAASRRFRTMSDQDISAVLLRELIAARPSMAGRVAPIAVMNWSANPFSGGTFAYRSPGQIGRYGNIASTPLGRLHFAGEHTAELLSGLEGAMESGERAALEVLRSQ